MAVNKQINIDINTNSQETQKEFENLRKSIATANKEVEDLSKQFGENSKEADAARKSLAGLTVAYDEMTKEATDLGASFEDVYGEMKPLTGQMGEMEDRLYQLALAGDTTSQEYQDLLQAVGEYRRVQIQTDLAVDQAAETMTGKLGKAIEGATSGFAAVQGVMGLVGSESESLEKTLVKVQSALAIQQGVKGMMDFAKSTNLAGKAMKVFNLIVSLNPLTIIITAVVALIGYFAVFTDAIDAVTDALKSVGDWLGITNFEEEELEQERQKRAEAEKKRQQEAIDDAKRYREELKKQNDLEQRYSDNRIKRLETQRKLAKGNAEEERKIDEQITEEKLAQLNKQKEDFIEDQKARLQELDANRKSNAAAEKRIQAGISKAGDDFYKKKKRNEEAFYKLKEQLRTNDFVALQEIDDQIAGVEADATVRENDELKKRQDNYKNYLKARLDAARRIEDVENRLREEGIEKDLEINRDKFRREREDLEKNENINRAERIRLLELSIEEEAKEEQKIRDKYAEEKRKEDERREKEAADALKQVKVKTGQETLNLLQEQLQAETALIIKENEERKRIEQEAAERRKRNIEFSIESTKQGLDVILSLTEIFGNKSEKAARRAFNIQKGAQIASATIDTYRNAVSAYGSQFVPVPDPTSPVRGGIAAGIAVAAGLANITKIASQKFEGGGGGGAVAEPSTAGLEGGGAITPEFNVVGDSGINQLAQLQQQPVQAFVVSGDVTTAQSLDRNRVQNATL